MSDQYFTCPKCGGRYFSTVGGPNLETVKCNTMSDGGPETRVWTKALKAIMQDDLTRLTQCDWVGPRSESCRTDWEEGDDV